MARAGLKAKSPLWDKPTPLRSIFSQRVTGSRRDCWGHTAPPPLASLPKHISRVPVSSDADLSVSETHVTATVLAVMPHGDVNLTTLPVYSTVWTL